MLKSLHHNLRHRHHHHRKHFPLTWWCPEDGSDPVTYLRSGGCWIILVGFLNQVHPISRGYLKLNPACSLSHCLSARSTRSQVSWVMWKVWWRSDNARSCFGLGLNGGCRWKTLLIKGSVDVTSRLPDLDCGILWEGSTSPAECFQLASEPWARPDALAVCLNSENQPSMNSTKWLYQAKSRGQMATIPINNPLDSFGSKHAVWRLWKCLLGRRSSFASTSMQKGVRFLIRWEDHEKRMARVLAGLLSAVQLYEGQAKVAWVIDNPQPDVAVFDQNTHRQKNTASVHCLVYRAGQEDQHQR